MKQLLVPIKRVLDYRVRVRVKRDESGVDLANAKMIMNPFDAIALEEALRLREKGLAESVIVCSVGAASCQETLRTALAMGADQAYLIETPATMDPLSIEPLTVAKLLRALIKKIHDREDASIDLVLMGKQAIDDDANQTGQMLAALLDWPQATFASSVTVDDRGDIEVAREVDGGTEVIAFTLPGVITADLRLNEPRYASLPNIMKAKRQSIEIWPVDACGVDVTPRQTYHKVVAPFRRTRLKRRLDSVEALVDALKQEGFL